MELARLASNKQARSNKQQLAPQGPFWCAGQKGSQNREKKGLPRHPGWFSAPFSGTNFFRSDLQVVAKGGLLSFWPVLGRGRIEKFSPRAKNKKTQFPGARGTLGGGDPSTQKFLPKIPLFFLHFAFSPTGPRGARNRKMVVF